MRAALSFLLVVSLSACDGGHRTDAGSDASSDASSDAGAGGDSGTDAGVICAAGEACNARTVGGVCPGECITQVRFPACPGVVRHGLCFAGDLPAFATRYGLPQGLEGELVEVPAEGVAGEPSIFRIAIHNPGAEATVQLRLEPGYLWTLDQVVPAQGPWTIAAGADVELRVTLHRDQASVFVPDTWVAAYVYFDSAQISVPIPVGFGTTSEIACGGRTFPATFCESASCTASHRHYERGRCCGEIFYPQADCCSSADCAEGACVEGVCVARVPANGLSPSPLGGRQRVLVALADLPVTPSSEPCQDRGDLVPALGLDAVAAWLSAVYQARTHRGDLQIEWRVIAVESSDAFVTGGDYTPARYAEELEAYLASRGCIASLDDDFDRALLISPRLVLANPGEAFAIGRAAQYGPDAALGAHELAHLYGANDLYRSAAGTAHFARALMGLGSVLAQASDAVLWAEVGLGDTDDNGVIDTFDFPREPEALALAEATAALDAGSLSVQLGFDAVEAGVARPIRILRSDVTLIDYGVTRPAYSEARAFFTTSDADLAAIASAGQVNVRVRASYRYTGAAGERRRVDLDETRTLPIP
ncbi:MAG: hypothetical protein K8H88_12610 [Sandaracinaceae bacterium]|nr:hypothetical protein [Sandaracinaceae bacterium]